MVTLVQNRGQGRTLVNTVINVRVGLHVTVNCRESNREYLAMIYGRDSKCWRTGSLRVLREQRTGENSHITFSFTRTSKILLVLRAKTWRLPNQLFVNTLE